MTLKQERAYKARIEAAKKERDRLLAELDAEDDAEPLEDEEYNAREEAARKIYLNAVAAYEDTKIREIRPNAWYQDFLASFGGPVKSRKVTERQIKIFLEKADFIRAGHNASEYIFKFSGLVYEITVGTSGGYITIRAENI